VIQILEIGINQLGGEIEQGFALGRRFGKFGAKIHEGEADAT
jgi:hypothetical protein